ncbi:hypothetical protein ABZ793_28305 [Micromonospora sp. NPDC047465]|uniref:hypothetical protein n=1 Tax=Micromonospora sp. NPDC047465 TaxID=3154813 RepID=UPI0033EFA090
MTLIRMCGIHPHQAVLLAAIPARDLLIVHQGLLKNAPILGTEYHYRSSDGTVLVRATGRAKPTAAKKIEQAVAQLSE